jgi:hypothetical protein
MTSFLTELNALPLLASFPLTTVNYNVINVYHRWVVGHTIMNAMSLSGSLIYLHSHSQISVQYMCVSSYEYVCLFVHVCGWQK